MDGNGRWATERGKPRSAGHIAGVETAKDVIANCVRLGVKYLTLYAFSTENWNRPADEVATLMGLILTELKDELFVKNNVRMRWIGDRSRLPQQVRKHLEDMEEETSGFTAMTVSFAISYSSRWEITKAMRDILWEIKNTNLTFNTVDDNDITEETISQHLETYFMPDPDLLIRTGGELRISNYLLWQIAYSELYFTNTYWPEFEEKELHKAIADYQQRQRRFGKTEEQVETENNTAHEKQ